MIFRHPLYILDLTNVRDVSALHYFRSFRGRLRMTILIARTLLLIGMQIIVISPALSKPAATPTKPAPQAAAQTVKSSTNATADNDSVKQLVEGLKGLLGDVSIKQQNGGLKIRSQM